MSALLLEGFWRYLEHIIQPRFSDLLRGRVRLKRNQAIANIAEKCRTHSMSYEQAAAEVPDPTAEVTCDAPTVSQSQSEQEEKKNLTLTENQKPLKQIGTGVDNQSTMRNALQIGTGADNQNTMRNALLVFRYHSSAGMLHSTASPRLGDLDSFHSAKLEHLEAGGLSPPQLNDSQRLRATIFPSKNRHNG